MTENGAWRHEAEDLRRRVEIIETHGTRGVSVLSVQVQQLISAMADQRAEMRAWQHKHEQDHQREQAQRISGRRWLVGTCIAAVMMLVAVLALLVDIAGKPGM